MNSLELNKIESDDLAICVNYVVEEYENLVGHNLNSKSLSARFSRDIKDLDGFKVSLSGALIGFAFYEEWSGNLLITSFFINKKYRKSKVMYMLFKACVEASKDMPMIYIPLHDKMTLPGALCSNGIINKNKAIDFINKVESRYKK